MAHIVLFLKGVIIGVGKMIPGVSGGMFAILFGVYDKGIYAIAHFFEDIKKHGKFLFVIGSGIFLSMILISNVMVYLLHYYYLETMLFMIGLMSGGVFVFKNDAIKNMCIKKWIILLLSLFFPFLFTLIPSGFCIDNGVVSNFLMLILVGFIDAGTMVIPGISGTVILMILGYYEVIVEVLSKVLNFRMWGSIIGILFPYVIGMMLGIYIFVLLMDFLISKYCDKLNIVMFGFALSSLFLIFSSTLSYNYSVFKIVIGLVCFVIGFIFSLIMEKISN